MPSGSLHLAQKGQQRALLRSLTAIVLRNKKTDGRDRLIIFDIPEKQRSARDVLRRKLREFECQQLQRSVYITPYVCEDELHEITRILKITPHVHVLKVMTT
jgi:DNA-binding transcriptional regulator PaaX